MSILPMYKKCPYCHRKFYYNPSTGKFGFTCPHCGRLQRAEDEKPLSKTKKLL